MHITSTTQARFDAIQLAIGPDIPADLEEWLSTAELWELEQLLAALTECRDALIEIKGLADPEVAEIEARRRRCRMETDRRRLEVWPPDAA